MAFLTAEEFGAAIGVLAEHHGVERLRERLARLNAFTSRRGLNSAPAIADRLFALSGGLRRQVGATFAFTSLWQELVGARLGETGEKRLETLGQISATEKLGRVSPPTIRSSRGRRRTSTARSRPIARRSPRWPDRRWHASTC